jgi:hypothetical protein
VRPRGVPLAVSGRSRVEAEELQRKLGDTAWFLLLQLWRVRDAKTGETHVTNDGLASGVGGFVKQTRRVIRKACCRLIDAGLLVFVGRKVREVLRGRARVSLPVNVRVVRGAQAEQGLGAERVVFVPKKTADWLPAAYGWGGARRPSKRGIREGQEGHQTPRIGSSKRGTRSESMDPLEKGPFDSRPSDENTAARSSAVSVPLFGWGELGSAPDTSGREGAVPAPGQGYDASTPGGPPDATPEAPEPIVGPSGDPTVGLRLEAAPLRPKAPVMPTSPLDGCPPLPWGLVRFATVPNPPNLAPEMKPDERAHRLADAFRGALASRFPDATDFSFRNGVLSRSKHYPMLLEAAEFMVARELAPAAWAAWSMDVWKTYTEKSRPPTVAWVFGPKRLVEKRGWFESQESSYLGGTLLPTPKRDALFRRYMSLRYAIHNARAWDDPAPFVARFFPDDLFDRLVAEARAEVERARARVQREVDSGRFFW